MERRGEDAWESQRCCRVNGALLSREPFSRFPEVPILTPPPTQYSLSSYTHTHTQTTHIHIHSIHLSVFHNLFCHYNTPSLSLSPLSLHPSWCLSWHSPSPLYFPLISHKQTWPVPPPALPRLLIILPHLCDCHVTQTVKAKKKKWKRDAISSFASPPSYPELCFQTVYVG